MSRSYRIRISESVTKTIHVKDGLSFRMELLDVLAPERMAQLLKDELANRDFTENDDGIFVKKVEDVDVEVNTTTGEVTLRIASDATVTKSVDKEAYVYDDRPADVKRRVEEARTALEREVDHDQAELQRKVTETLERHLGDIRAELDKVSTRVVAEGLKQRAAEIGEIEEISEDEETGNMIIRVRV